MVPLVVAGVPAHSPEDDQDVIPDEVGPGGS